MIKRSDIWAIFLLSVHVFLIQMLSNIIQTIMLPRTAQLTSTQPIFWVKIVISSVLVFLFFNSLYKCIFLISAPEDRFDVRLRSSVMAFFWLLSFLFIASVFPRI